MAYINGKEILFGAELSGVIITSDGDIDALIDGSISKISSVAVKVRPQAFQDCTALTAAVFPQVAEIGNSAFRNCSSLTSFAVSNSAASIGAMAFVGCTGLTSVTFANTKGWYVTETADGDALTGIPVDVTDPANNVTLLTETYAQYYWHRATHTVSGSWTFNDEVTFPASDLLYEPFGGGVVVGGGIYSAILLKRSSLIIEGEEQEDTYYTVYDDGWDSDECHSWDFGEGTEVSAVFYAWLTENATQD